MQNIKNEVSVIVMTKNEEKNIAKCLKSLACFNEVFVVDSMSTDNTCKIAKDYGAKIVNFEWDGKYPKKKQWCLTNLKLANDWVLYVDADEEVCPELSSEVLEAVNNSSNISGYFVGYNYVFMGKVLKHGHRVFKLVLFKKSKGKFIDYDDLDVVNMWEVEGHYQPEIVGKTGVMKNRMLHNDHDNLYHFFNKINKYSDWEATLRNKNMLRDTRQSTLKYRKYIQLVSDRTPLKGIAIFLYSYIIRLGFMDGVAGFYYATALSIYYSMISMKCCENKLQRKMYNG